MPRQAYYGAVGNGQTVALVGTDLTVAWLCLPRFDGVPLVASGLDPRRGGGWELRIDGRLPTPVRQSYLGDTNVLQTVATGGGLEITVVDWMPYGRPVLVREVTLRNPGGAPRRATLEAHLQPVAARDFPWETAALPVRPSPPAPAVGEAGGSGPPGRHGGWVVLRFAGDADRLAQACPIPPGPDGRRGIYVAWGPAGRYTYPLAPGGQVRLRFTLGYGPDGAAALAAAAGEGQQASLADEIGFWQRWLAGAHPPPLDDPDLAALYRRSLLVLKLLQHRGGAWVAAATAAWPAVPGGDHNWDYRYCWIRDGCYTALAFDLAGLHAEARAFYELMFTVQAEDGSWPRPLIRVDGGAPAEFIAADLAGPRGERPVRFGNAALDQLQLDSAGHVLHGVLEHGRATGDWAWLRRRWPQVRRAADWVIDNWRRPEHGIWEF
ncbi:MAG TPA: glycoside hydrolase family 15 protein, partial [Bacillota bacterium]